MKRPWSVAGVSMLEIVVSLSFTLLAAALGMPAVVNRIRTYRLENAAVILEFQMMRARTLAVTKNCRYRLKFTPDQNCYVIQEDWNQNRIIDPGETVSPPVFLPQGVRFDCSGVLGPPSNPARPPAGPVTFTACVMSVGPDGCWSNPGTVYLGNGSGDRLALSVTIAGRIRIWTWDPGRRSWV